MDDIDDEDLEFLSLADLLRSPAAGQPPVCVPAQLADAIEAHGIHAYDRFDRLVKHPPDSEAAAAALDLLAWLVKTRNTPPHELDHDPDAWFDFDSPSNRYGWPVANMPPMRKLGARSADLGSESGAVAVAGDEPVDAAESSSNLRLADAVRRLKTYDCLVGALLMYIDGSLQVGRHPDFVSDGQLIRLLADEMKGYRGLSDRTLHARFKEARSAVNSPS